MIKEAWTDMRNQPVIGIVTVIGTALAIFLIMMVTISAQVNTMPIARRTTATARSTQSSSVL